MRQESGLSSSSNPDLPRQRHFFPPKKRAGKLGGSSGELDALCVGFWKETQRLNAYARDLENGAMRLRPAGLVAQACHLEAELAETLARIVDGELVGKFGLGNA